MNRVPRLRRPDIDFTSTVHAERMCWRDDPETGVSFSGSPGYRSRSDSDRVNLPDRVRAGETYENVRVDYRLAAALDEDEPG
ncbi:hypothetical protein [Saccharomonospora iraqiensis]|uniref:hypothetical protein n=1 Tax=Saccharomonospora iraqiensis TaxID=52698 RepID=UPI00022E82AA|nr:hypothetical protein [Saccharomonospora iraqiensis]